MRIEIFEKEYAVCKFPAGTGIPDWANEIFTSVTVCDNELSIVCRRNLAPDGVEFESDWALMRIVGQIDFGEVGVVAKISKTLADQQIPIFVISTFNTDYILVKQPFLDLSKTSLQKAGYEIVSSDCAD